VNNALHVTGIVLKSDPVGENDKRVVLLTRERGEISAFARGARRPNSHLLSATNLFSYGEFELYEGRNSYTIKSFHLEKAFMELSEDLTRVAYASYFTEVASYYGQEGMDESQRILLLYQSYRALSSGKFPPEFLKAVYELKTMALSGDYPNVYECMECSSTEDLVGFSMEKRGCLCKKHYTSVVGNRPLSPSCLYAVQFVISTKMASLYSFRLAEDVEREFIQFVRDYRKRFFHHRYKSEEMLAILQ